MVIFQQLQVIQYKERDSKERYVISRRIKTPIEQEGEPHADEERFL